MLRRSPTALTITPQDITDFEAFYVRRIAHLHYLKTGQDPNGWFAHIPQAATDPDFVTKQIMYENQRRMMDSMGNNGQPDEGQQRRGQIDPSDELKPLPGDKARIVRGREERIVGTGGGRG